MIILRHKRKIAFFPSLSFSKVHFLGHCVAFITVFEDTGLRTNNAPLSEGAGSCEHRSQGQGPAREAGEQGGTW